MIQPTKQEEKELKHYYSRPQTYIRIGDLEISSHLSTKKLAGVVISMLNNRTIQKVLDVSKKKRMSGSQCIG